MKILKILNYVFPLKQKLKFLLMFLLSFIGSLMEFAGVSLILPFVNILINPNIDQAKWYIWLTRLLGTTDRADVLFWLTIGLIGVYVVKNAYMLLLINLRVHLISKNNIVVSSRMIGYFMRKPYTYHLEHSSNEVARTINHDVGSLFSMVSTLFGLVSDAVITVSLIIFLFKVNPVLTGTVAIGIAICSVLYFLVVKKKIREFGQENRKSHVKMNRSIYQAMGAIKEVKIMGREQFFAECYSKYGAEYVELNRRYSVVSAIPSRLIETVCIGGVLGVIAYQIKSSNGNIEALTQIVPQLSAFAVACMRLLPTANSINSCFSSITYLTPSVEAIYEEIRSSEEYEARIALEAEEKKRINGEINVAPNSDIRLENIKFTYPNMDEPVLHDISITIPHGTSVGIVGVTGAGKTTLVDIILGLLEPQEGNVFYGDLDIRQDYKQWQERIGYIPQFIYLTDDTIRNNVALGLYEDEIDEARVWKALEDAQIAEFVRGLKDGLDTVIGERGVRLSGGQRQRLGIARALYYNPEVLFFDEATSALDNETEQKVMEAINALSGTKTMIIVAHRLTTIEKCDQILRVVDGTVEPATLE